MKHVESGSGKKKKKRKRLSTQWGKDLCNTLPNVLDAKGSQNLIRDCTGSWK